MKKIYALASTLILLATAATAQVQIGVQGSYLKGTGDNNSSLWGGGAHAKFYVGQHLAFGGAVRVYPKNTQAETINGTTYTSGDYLTNVSGSVDILLSKKDDLIQTFIGADAGVSFNNHTVTYSNNGTQYAINNNKNFFLASPKIGVNVGLLPSFGVFGQAMYNLTFGNGKDLDNSTLPQSLDTKPVDKYFTFDVGLYFRLVGAKK
jgi:hypothetical protein